MLWLVSVRDGGRSYPREVRGRAGDWGGRITGRERFSRSSWAHVVVGSLRRDRADVFWPTSYRRGVDGGRQCAEDGVVGVGMLDTDDWAEWPPRRDCDRLARLKIGPPLSDTGSSDDDVWVRS